jgi:hypothetical protein
MNKQRQAVIRSKGRFGSNKAITVHYALTLRTPAGQGPRVAKIGA